jgi:Domain of unknown function (DUF4202)
VTDSFQPRDPKRFEAALRRFDEANGRDPNREVMGGIPYAREALYARRLTEWVLRLYPNASEELRLAARCQHICRWEIPRRSYPMTRNGYLEWRATLRIFHSQKAGEILRETGYGETVIRRVRDLNFKKDFPDDPETRALEDALCLMFLEHQFGELAARTPDDKMISALIKIWPKMTKAARIEAMMLGYGEREKKLFGSMLAHFTNQPSPSESP